MSTVPCFLSKKCTCDKCECVKDGSVGNEALMSSATKEFWLMFCTKSMGFFSLFTSGEVWKNQNKRLIANLQILRELVIRVAVKTKATLAL